jgi:hypothetical protein
MEQGKACLPTLATATKQRERTYSNVGNTAPSTAECV